MYVRTRCVPLFLPTSFTWLWNIFLLIKVVNSIICLTPISLGKKNSRCQKTCSTTKYFLSYFSQFSAHTRKIKLQYLENDDQNHEFHLSKDLCNTTEPHRNVAVSAKHYRFFLSGLKDLFEVLFLIPFIKTRDFIKQFCDLNHKTFQFKGWMKFKRNDKMNVAIFKWGKQLL